MALVANESRLQTPSPRHTCTNSNALESVFLISRLCNIVNTVLVVHLFPPISKIKPGTIKFV